MMRVMLDSNALIWAVSDPKKLSKRATQVLEDRENHIFVSLVSLWEITIKISRGRLPQLGPSIQYLLNEVSEQRFELLSMRPEDLLALGTLEPHHRDPFDRMLIAQSLTNHLPIVTIDPFFSLYPVDVFW